jgi:hypothetical protein
LPDEAMIVAYYPGQTKTMIFAATKEKLHVYSSDLGRQELDRLVAQSRRALTSRQTSDGALSELYQALIAPLDPLLADKSVLAVVPSGTLYYLPFAALKQAGGKPLADKVGVTFLTATELPDVGSFGTRPKPSRFLALANPDGSLPGARQEVERIAPLFAQQHSYFGPEATQDKLKGTRLIVDAMKNAGVNPDRVIIDHVEEHTAAIALDAGFWAGMTLYPESKCTPARAIDILETFGTERIWMNSACDWGISDPLAVVKCALEMKKRQHRGELIEKVIYGNPRTFLSQSPNFKV